jgi:hypothetical protein
VVNTVDGRFKQQLNFRFETFWLEQQVFREAVINKWPERGESYKQDFWRDIKASTRKFCRGWGINTQSQIKKDKKLCPEKN